MTSAGRAWLALAGPSMNSHFQRGTLLLQQGRHELAAGEFRLALAESPGDGLGHALLAHCYSALQRYPESEAEAAAAIALEPDSAYVHYAMARVQESRNDPVRALASIREAVRLDPKDADCLAMLAAILLDLKRTNEALGAAEAALAEDPAHVAANNVRAMALVALGRRAEAGATLDAALAREPENSWTHANRGWGHLHEGDPQSALRHFREAMRLDPDNDWARRGIVEAVKARNPVYALMLRYTLWMQAQSGRMQWGLVVGAWLAFRVVGVVGARYPALVPVVLPLQIAYILLAWFSWTAVPLSNLVLRLNRHGRLALFPEQIRESNWVAGFVGAALACLGVWLAGGRDIVWLLAAGVGAFLVVPVKAGFNCQPGWPRRVMAVYTAIMVAMGYGAILGLLVAERMGKAGDPWADAAVKTLLAFLVGVLLSGWVGNALGMVRVRR